MDDKKKITPDDFLAYCLVNGLVVWNRERLDASYPLDYEGYVMAGQYADTLGSHEIFAAALREDGTADVMTCADGDLGDEYTNVDATVFCSGKPCHVSWRS